MLEYAPAPSAPAQRLLLAYAASHTLSKYPRLKMEAATTTDREGFSRDLHAGLLESGQRRAAAETELHQLLLRGARHELARRADLLRELSPAEIDDLAHQAAGDAMAAIMAKLGTFEGKALFTTWAYKFVILEAGVRARRRAWQDRELPIDDDSWRALVSPLPDAQERAESSEMLVVISDAIATQLTPHQREVFVALALNGVPLDVLVERTQSTRGALYKTLHDARHKLRTALVAAGYEPDSTGASA